MAQAILSEPVVAGNSLPGAMPILSLVNGHPRASSLTVAEHFKKRHTNVLRSITQTCHNLPKEFNALNFEPVEFTDSKGEKRPAYLMTRDGFALIVMGFTGKEAMAWKLRYIEAFNAMEAELARQQTPAPTLPTTLTTSSRLSIQNLIAAKVSHYPSELRPKAFKEAWLRVKNKFQVAKYEEIPEATYPEVVAYILAMVMRLALPAPEAPKALPEPPKAGTIQSYAWFYPGLPEGPEMWRRLSFGAADAFERLGKDLDTIKAEAFRPFRENRRSGVATFLDAAMGPHRAMFAIADEHMRTAYRCIFESLDGLVAIHALLRRG